MTERGTTRTYIVRLVVRVLAARGVLGGGRISGDGRSAAISPPDTRSKKHAARDVGVPCVREVLVWPLALSRRRGCV